MPQQIVIAEQLRIAAVLNEERVDELIVAQGRHQIGDVYLGTVENVLPGIDAAFVNIGESEKNGFIHLSGTGNEGAHRHEGAPFNGQSFFARPVFGAAAPWPRGKYLSPHCG
jgi:Ribonuclease G/E